MITGRSSHPLFTPESRFFTPSRSSARALDMAAGGQHPGSRGWVVWPDGKGRDHDDERMEQGDQANSCPERVDEALLGSGQAGRAGAAALPGVRALPASAVRDLRELYGDRPRVRTRQRQGL